MKHAGEVTLDLLEDLLREVRKHAALRERRRGAFYRKSDGILHFHEDPAGLFADLKVDGKWQRFSIDSKAERQALLSELAAVVAVD
jgi:hypothetical protein